MRVKNKLFVVTGAGGGIGGELTRVLIEKGARVAAVDIDRDSLENLKQSLGRDNKILSAYPLDITDRKAVEQLPESIRNFQGEVDGLINNAGIIQPFVKLKDLDFGVIERIMNINFYGTLNMLKTFLPLLLERPEAHIVNVSSMGGFLPVPGQTVYCASKAAVKLLTEGLWGELRNTRVKVTVVFPGATETDIAKKSGVEVSTQARGEQSKIPTLKPRVVAELIVEGLERDRLYVFTGRDSNLMSLFYRIKPQFALNMITKQMGSLLTD